MTTLDKVRSGLDRAQAAVGAAESMLHEGHVIDLGGLEADVEVLCADINTLEPGDRVTLKPPLIALIDGLNRLAEQIAERNREIGDELRGTSERQRAATAYLSGRGRGPVR